MLSALFGLGLAMAPVAAVEQPCVPFGGAAAVLEDREVHWLVIGEMHGTRETPASFAELVCGAVNQHRKVTVALEFPSDDQGAIDAYMASDGGADARRRVLALPFWSAGVPDGRSSEAAFALLERLREMKHAGQIRGVASIKPPRDGLLSDDEYEDAMAKLVLQAGPRGALTMVLVGGVHAQKTPYSRPGLAGYVPMAGHLPPEHTRTVLASGQGGSAWTCQLPAAEENFECGPHALGVPRKLYPRGLVMLDRTDGAYNGYLNTGAPFTVSPPMVPAREVQP